MTAKRPHGNTYWLSPAGCLPASTPVQPTPMRQPPSCGSTSTAGIDCFIDLTEVGELEPYEERLYAEATARGKQVQYLRLPICDVSVPQSPDRMREILDTIEAALSAKRTVLTRAVRGALPHYTVRRRWGTSTLCECY